MGSSTATTSNETGPRYYRLHVPNVVITEGVKRLTNDKDAFWLVTDIAAYFFTPEMEKAIAADSRLQHMQFWRLDVNEDKSATLTLVADTDEPPAFLKKYSYTDFPDASVRIWAAFDGKTWCLHLPEEY